MTKIVVLGAGIGGVPLAFELKDLLGKKADVTVISQTEYFQFVPSNHGSRSNGASPTTLRLILPRSSRSAKLASPRSPEAHEA